MQNLYFDMPVYPIYKPLNFRLIFASKCQPLVKKIFKIFPTYYTILSSQIPHYVEPELGKIFCCYTMKKKFFWTFFNKKL